MKKILFLTVVLGLVFSSMVFAADYVVVSVTGVVQREVSPEKWETIKAGDVLTAATMVNTGMNSSLVLKMDDKTVTVKAMQKGMVERLYAAENSGGVRISGRVSENSTVISSRGTANISTASTRASEAAGDTQWEEE